MKVKNNWLYYAISGWLDEYSDILFAAEQLLHQFPANSGLKDPRLQQIMAFDVQKNKEFVQCLNLGRLGRFRTDLRQS